MNNKKDIIIFGTGKFGEELFYKLAHLYTISFFCDNDESRWGALYCGVKVISPSELKEHLKQKHSQVYIASIYYLPIAIQLEKLGIHDYLIYGYLPPAYSGALLPKHRVAEELTMLSNFLRTNETETSTTEKRAVYNDLTLILPTSNTDLAPCLTYLSNMPATFFEIIILDSSEEEIRELNQILVKKCNNIKVSYFTAQELPKEYINVPKAIGFYALWLALTQKVKTKYCTLIRDDDYILPDNLSEALDIMNTNSDIGAVKGKHAWYQSKVYKNNGIEYRNRNFDLVHVSYKPPSCLMSECAEKRATDYSTFLYSDNFHIINRTSALLETLSTVVKFGCYEEIDSFFTEYIFDYAYVLLNKIQTIDNVIYMKDQTPRQVYIDMMSHYSVELIERNIRLFKLIINDICAARNIEVSAETIELVAANLVLKLHLHYACHLDKDS